MTPKARGKNLTYLRSSNQGAVLKTLLVNGSASRQQLANKLKLTTMSITYLVNELIEKGIVIEKNGETAAKNSGAPGRKPISLSLVPGQLHAIGVYVSRESVRCSICNIGGEIVQKIEVKLGPETTKSLLSDTICSKVAELLKTHSGKQILGIGVASVGLVDTGAGTVISTTEFFGVSDWNIRGILEDRFAMPVYVVEDMKAACLAESYYGAAQGLTDFVYLGVTHGIGAGVVINERLFEGIRGFSSEIGHTSINHRGKKCTCGNTGCMELYLSVPVLLNKAGLLTWEEFLEFCRRDITNPVLEQYIRDMGIALTNIIHIFDPQAIVIGHEGATLGTYCFEKLQIQVDTQSMTRRVKKVQILPSSLNQFIPYLEAPSIVFSQLFQGVIQV